MEDEQGVVHWGQANAVDLGALAANAEAKRKIEELEAASERLREELHQTKRELEELRAGERRKRIERWRAEIRAHPFARYPFGTYDLLKPKRIRRWGRICRPTFGSGTSLDSPQKQFFPRHAKQAAQEISACCWMRSHG